MSDSVSILPREAGRAIAYCRSAGRAPGIVFLPGFRSDMSGGKALALEAHCRAAGRAFLRFDYTGHGRSQGRFEDGTVGAWRADTIDALDKLTDGPQVLVGSSMGGWLALLAALARPARVAGIVGIAAAADFATRLMLRRFDAAQRAALERDGIVHLPSAYSPEPTPVTKALVVEARAHEVLGAPIPLRCPVRLIHGTADPDVPWQLSLEIAERLESDDVEVILVKDGDHRLSSDRDLARLCRAAEDVCREVESGAAPP
ncbi:MAG: alpha/beta hydrolase [Rhodospirillaceae bacterium]|nr:alpha/beta hydrolase [Rhodospirillaceae bacterium]